MTLDQLVFLCRCPRTKTDLKVSDDNNYVISESGYRYPLLNHRTPVLLINRDTKEEGGTNLSDLRTFETFSEQWKMYQKGDKVWRWKREDLLPYFLHNIGLEKSQLKGKLILDLGCGHGIYCSLLAESGATAVGLDISNGFMITESALPEELKPACHFIQADAFNCPLKENVFDLVWSSGVLIVTPDTKETFRRVSNVVKKGGRFYLWLYKPVFYTPLLTVIRSITKHLPEKILVPLGYILAPFFGLVKGFLNITGLGYRKFEKRNLRENALSIHDTLATPYRWHHRKEEIIGWFKENGFQNITASEDSALGYGIYGDKI